LASDKRLLKEQKQGMEVIPAIDLLSGRVRLYQETTRDAQVFNDNPADVGRQWVEQEQGYTS